MSTADPLRIALFQYAARDEPVGARLDRLDAAAGRAAARGARLLITPEMYLSGYALPRRTIHARAEARDGEAAHAVAALCRRHGMAIVYGYPESAEGIVYNTARCIDADGATRAVHRKRKLAGPGERAVFAPGGGDMAAFTCAGFRLALLICYDAEFPELVRACAMAGAEALVVPTALVVEHPFVARHMIPTRAFENGIHLAYVNYAGCEGAANYLGESTVAGPDGDPLARAGDGEQLVIADIERGRMERARATLPYLDDAQDLTPPA